MDLKDLESRIEILENNDREQSLCLENINKVLGEIRYDMQPLRDWKATGRSVKRVAVIAGALATIGGFLSGIYLVFKLLVLRT